LFASSWVVRARSAATAIDPNATVSFSFIAHALAAIRNGSILPFR
jgi:hypothetical protein